MNQQSPGKILFRKRYIEAKKQLKADYENTVKLFKEELERDYNSAKESYTEDPYKSAPVKETANGATIRTGFDEIISFMYAEGFVTIKYEEGADGKIDRTKIKEAILDYSTDVVKDKASAIQKIASLLNDNGLFVLSIDKNQSDFIDMGIRQVKIYPDNPTDICHFIANANLELTDQFETENAHVIVSKKASLL